jgi:hypothetical protein
VAGLGFALVASAITAVIVDPRLAVLLLGAATPIANVPQLCCTAVTAWCFAGMAALLSR